jgi:PhnB protein
MKTKTLLWFKFAACDVVSVGGNHLGLRVRRRYQRCFLGFRAPPRVEPSRSPKLAPYLVVKDAPGLIRFLERALGANLTFEEKGPDGRLVHAEVRIADGLVMIGEAPSDQRLSPAMIHLYVDDADSAYARALSTGASSVRPPTDSPDGTRRGGVQDPWGNQWWFSHVLKANAAERSRIR